jgi:hypothetical protein
MNTRNWGKYRRIAIEISDHQQMTAAAFVPRSLCASGDVTDSRKLVRGHSEATTGIDGALRSFGYGGGLIDQQKPY